MHKRLFVLLFFTNLLGLKGQIEKQKPRVSELDFSYSTGYQHVRMENMNRYYLDTFAKPNDIFTKNVHHTLSRNFQFCYHFSHYFGIGMMAKTDLFQMDHSSPTYVMDQVGTITDTFSTKSQLNFRKASIGLFGAFDLGEFVQTKTKQAYFKKWKANVLGGASIDLYNIELGSTSPYFSHNYLYFAPCIGGFAQLKINYPIFSWKFAEMRLGLNLGYQFSKTKTLRTDQSGDWIVYGKYPINADFSGINLGLGLSIELTDHKFSARDNAPSKNALYLDVFGQSTYGSFIYERIFNVESTRVQHALSVGFMRLNRIPWDYLGVLSIPLAYNAYFDFNRTKNKPSKLELGFGLTALGITSFDYDPNQKTQYLYPSLRFGYCYHSYHSGLLFKATFTPLLPGFVREEFMSGHETYFGSAGFFDEYVMPWVGLSIGKTF